MEASPALHWGTLWQLLLGFGVFVSLLHGNQSPAALTAAEAALGFLHWLQQPLLGLLWPSGLANLCPVSNSTRERGRSVLSPN